MIMVGESRASMFAPAVTFQLGSGLAAACLCHFQRTRAKAQYAVSRSIRLLSAQNRNLLHTLIPADVAARLAAHPPGEMLEASMEHVILMFCSIAPRPADPDAFALLHRVFSDFDAAVAAAGMFKYQVRPRAMHAPRLMRSFGKYYRRRTRARACMEGNSGLGEAEHAPSQRPQGRAVITP